MSATETLSVLMPPRPLSAPEIIDVDAFDDGGMEDIVMTGFHRMSQPSGSGSSSMRERLASDGLVYMGSRGPTTGRSRLNSSAEAPAFSRTTSQDIIVLDSDDEDVSASSSTSQRSQRAGRRLVSPPPPPPLRGHTPAVPPLPRHLSSQSSMPRHRHRHPPAHPPVIRPSEHPLPFETRMAALPRLPPRNSSPAVAAAPRSHHRPAMGFGGMVLSLNRQALIEDANREEREEREARHMFNLPSFTDIFSRISGRRSSSSTAAGNNVHSGLGRWAWSWFRDDWPLDDLSSSDVGEPWFNLPDASMPRGPSEKVVHWRPEYTHPGKANPGFSFDFAPSETTTPPPPVIILDDDAAGPSNVASSSSSAAAIETTLVCARCLDPLVLAAPEGTSEEERKKYRVWALRCGHMLDGKCIAELISPPAPAPAKSPAEEYTGKGKGKALAEPGVVPVQQQSDTDAQSPDAEVPAAPVDRKGKRKAVEPPEDEAETSPKRPALAESAPGDNSIRSRLRSHARATAHSGTHSEDETAAHLLDSPPQRRRGHAANRRLRLAGGFGTGRVLPEPSFTFSMDAAPSERQSRGRAKGKGKARARVEPKPAIEAEHEWKCPIAGCERVHYGVRIQGQWRNDDGRGAIALFV